MMNDVSCMVNGEWSMVNSLANRETANLKRLAKFEIYLRPCAARNSGRLPIAEQGFKLHLYPTRLTYELKNIITYEHNNTVRLFNNVITTHCITTIEQGIKKDSQPCGRLS